MIAITLGRFAWHEVIRIDRCLYQIVNYIQYILYIYIRVQNFSGNFFPFFWGIFFHFELSVLLEVFSVKIVGSIARNDPFGSFFCEIAGSIAQNARFASRETLVLEPSFPDLQRLRLTYPFIPPRFNQAFMQRSG